MILTDDEMRQLRGSIEAHAGLDQELLQRCGHLLHLGAFDEAVRSAFVLLEERLRNAVNVEGMTGTQLANHAFSPTKGPLAKHLGRNQSERDGLRELYSGAFRLFRNPTAHGVVGYSAAEGKAIIGLVDLLLRLVKRAEELPPQDLFPSNVEKAISLVESNRAWRNKPTTSFPGEMPNRRGPKALSVCKAVAPFQETRPVESREMG